MPDKHMSVAEFKRHLSDVMNEVVHTKQRVIVERRGRPMIVVSPIETVDTRTPGQRLATLAGFGGEEGEHFRQEMYELLPRLRSDFPREVPEFTRDQALNDAVRGRTLMDRHMSVAEVKRHFSDVMGEVMHTRRRIVVERRGGRWWPSCLWSKRRMPRPENAWRPRPVSWVKSRKSSRAS